MTYPWSIYQHFSFAWCSCKQQCTVPYYISCTQFTNLQLSHPHCLCWKVQQYILEDGNGQWLLWFTSSCVTSFLKHRPCPGIDMVVVVSQFFQ